MQLSLQSYEAFRKIGAELLISADVFKERAQSAKALLFDWDGVFHCGVKTGKRESTFSEMDSMGINMLRFGFYLLNNTQIPTFIITGENNPTAFHFAKREYFDGVFFGIRDKIVVCNWIEDRYKASISDAIFFFDDILDLSLSALCKLRLMISRSDNPLLRDFAKKQQYADYFTAHNGGSNAIRECSELVLEALGLFEQTTKERISYSTNYKNYIAELKAITPDFITLNDADQLKKSQDVIF